MSSDRAAVGNLTLAEHSLRNLARKLAHSQRTPTARQLAELARLKQAVTDARARL